MINKVIVTTALISIFLLTGCSPKSDQSKNEPSSTPVITDQSAITPTPIREGSDNTDLPFYQSGEEDPIIDPKPDIVAYGLFPSSDNFQINQVVNIPVSVGTQSPIATGEFEYKVYLSKSDNKWVEVFTGKHPGLEGNQDYNTDTKFTWKTPSESGEYQLKLAVDTNSRIDEWDEENNESPSITISVASENDKADLSMNQPYLTDSKSEEKINLKESLQKGKNYSVECPIGNTSLIDVNQAEVKLTIDKDGKLIQSNNDNVRAISSGMTLNSFWSWTPSTSGKYKITCSIDTQNQVVESNEKNNTATIDVEVSEY